MNYLQPLPRIDNMLWLAKLSRPFPTTNREILKTARGWHFSRSTVDFLKLIPEEELFETSDDFLTRCQQLATDIRQNVGVSEHVAS